MQKNEKNEQIIIESARLKVVSLKKSPFIISLETKYLP